jgi:hypothetical protein
VTSKIFRFGAAIYTAVVVARSTGPNRPNCEFRFLLWLLRQVRKNVRRRRPELWRGQAWLLHHYNSPSHTSVLTQQFLAKNKWLSSPTHRAPLIWHPETSSYFQKRNWKDADLIPMRRSRPSHRECLTLWQKRTSRRCSKNDGEGGTNVYMREGTTSRAMAADRPYGEFYDFYSVSPEYFG